MAVRVAGGEGPQVFLNRMLKGNCWNFAGFCGQEESGVIAGFLQFHGRMAADRLALASLPVHHYEGLA